MDDVSHIQLAINFADLIRSTLGPRGMNKMIVAKGQIVALTNDGATIVGNLKGGNPIVDLFKQLAKSQEEAVGDGTTTSVVLAGNLLSNAQELTKKGIHPTVVINGYNIALANAMNFLKGVSEEPDKEKIMRTAFGTKITPELVEHFIDILKDAKNPDELKTYKIKSSDPFKTEIFKGHIFQGFTRDEQMPNHVNGKVAVLNFPVNLKMDNFQVTNAKDLVEIEEADAKLKRGIVDKLKEMGVEWVFYTDTCKEFDAYLTEAGIAGVAIFRPIDIDTICLSTGSKAITSSDLIDENHIGQAEVTYMKGADSNPGAVYVKGDYETLVVHGPTDHVLDEIERSLDDVLRLLRHNLDMVVGAGAIEIQTAKYLRELQLGGKEQLAIEKFADAIESIPLIIAENCGLDAIETLTNLKALHAKGDSNQGVDMVSGISNAREKGVFEPVLVKLHAISSATQVTNQILKLDAILAGEGDEN